MTMTPAESVEQPPRPRRRGLLALLGANRWLRFGTITRALLLVTVAGPLLGLVMLIFLCGSAETFFELGALAA